MTVTTTSNIDQYTADGVMSAYTFTFALLQAADLTVYINGAVTALAYTVAINSNGVGGTVTFSPTVPSNGDNLILAREVDYTQAVSIPGNANLRESTLETMVDRVVMQVQQVKEIVDRSLHFVIGSSINPELYEPDDDTIPFFDGTDVIWRTPNEIFNEMEGGGYGDMTGPASSIDGDLMMFNGISGKSAKASGLTGASKLVRRNSANTGFETKTDPFALITTPGANKIPIGDGTKYAELAAPTVANQSVIYDGSVIKWGNGIEVVKFGPFTPSNAGGAATNHNKTVTANTFMIGYLECLTSDDNWAVGDRCMYPPGPAASGVDYGFNSTQYFYRFTNNALPINFGDKTTGAISSKVNASWALYLIMIILP